MTAPASQHDSSNPDHSEPADQQGFVYDSSEAPQPEAEYVPEREFVLMPLFRRIGQLLGIRRHEEPEYIYESETEKPKPVAVSREQELQAETAQYENPEPTAADPEPLTANIETPSAQAAPPQILEQVPPEFSQSNEIHQPLEQVNAEYELPVEELAPAPISYEAHEAKEERISVVASPVEPSHTATALPASVEHQVSGPTPLTHEATHDLVAEIRDAVAKITTAVSEAAAWLHSKEEEILRRTEMPLHTERRMADLRPADSFQSTTIAPISSTGSEQQAVQELPARDFALQESHAERSEAETPALKAAAVAESQPERRLQIVDKPARVPAWKRIDWGQQFAPKRIALLGACVMAVLMVLGISLARRPAANALPPQARSLQPGGVTVTTHATAPKPAATRVNSTESAARPKPTGAAPHRQARSARAYDDGPDVVTHYYNKPKPSPIHQASVAGVRHYSDMQ